jgi:hypothetical protein
MGKRLLGVVGLVIFAAIGTWVFYELPRLIMQREQWPALLRVLVVYAIAAVPVVLVPDRLRAYVAVCTQMAAVTAANAVGRFGVNAYLRWFVAGLIIAPWPMLYLRELMRWGQRRRRGGTRE